MAIFLAFKGYAWSGGGRRIVRVDVTVDGGDTWHVADFACQAKTEAPKHWSWTLWSIRIPVSKEAKKVKRNLLLFVGIINSFLCLGFLMFKPEKAFASSISVTRCC